MTGRKADEFLPAPANETKNWSGVFYFFFLRAQNNPATGDWETMHGNYLVVCSGFLIDGL